MTVVASSTPNRDAEGTAAPVFLVGSVRSGTSLLRLMLDHHPELAVHFEFEHAVDRIGPAGELPPLDTYHAYLRQDRIFLLSGVEIDPSLPYEALVGSFLDQHRERTGKRLVGATVHHGFEKLDYVWPEAKYVHLVRDGRDVARSVIQMGWAGNMYCGVDRWIEAETAWARLRDRLPEERRLEVRYEDLIRDAEATLTEVCQFIGLDYDPAMFDYAETSTYGLPDPKLLNQWKRKLDEHEVQLAEARIGNMLVDRGYQLSNYSPIQVSDEEARRLRRDDWAARARFRWNRYGTSLFAADYLARKLRIGPWARWTKRRIDAIDNEHIR